MGEAGVGKSRLVYEFEQWLELRPETIRYFKGRATQQTQGIPQYLLRDALGRRFQILDSDPLAVLRRKFTIGIGANLLEQGEMKAHCWEPGSDTISGIAPTCISSATTRSSSRTARPSTWRSSSELSVQKRPQYCCCTTAWARWQLAELMGKSGG